MLNQLNSITWEKLSPLYSPVCIFQVIMITETFSSMNIHYTEVKNEINHILKLQDVPLNWLLVQKMQSRNGGTFVELAVP